MGELLKQFDGKGNNQHSRGTHTRLTQKEAAERAGISKDQTVTAVRVANIPRDQFEAAVESPKPPTVTALAEMGKQVRAIAPNGWIGNLCSCEKSDRARAMMSCWHGSVGTFMADANDSEMTSSVHLLLLMAIGLHGYGMEWRSALELRDQLVRTAKASDAQTARLPVEGGEASLVISIAGVPSFQIDTEQTSPIARGRLQRP